MGLKTARGSPTFSHLLFTYDIIFFCKENMQECRVILWILRDYEKASRRQINFTNSSLQFGHKVPKSIQIEVQQLLVFTMIEGIETDFGIP